MYKINNKKVNIEDFIKNLNISINDLRFNTFIKKDNTLMQIDITDVFDNISGDKCVILLKEYIDYINEDVLLRNKVLSSNILIGVEIVDKGKRKTNITNIENLSTPEEILVAIKMFEIA